MQAIEAKDLTKKYGSFLAVDHVNLAVKQGEIYGFLGPQRGREDDDHKDAHRGINPQ